MDIQKTEFIVDGISFIKKTKPNLHHYEDFIENDYLKLWKEIRKAIIHPTILNHHQFIQKK